MAKSSQLKRSRKATNNPPKPYKDYPLSPHASGKWQKRIKGKVHYFGRWGRMVKGKMERLPDDGWKEALEIFKAQVDDLQAGRVPKPKSDGLTIKELSNKFLTAKLHGVQAGEISRRTFNEYKATTDRLVSSFGLERLVEDLAPGDFESLRVELAKQYGPVRLGNSIQYIRTVFKYAFESGLLDKPIRYGPQFVKPSKSVLRKHRASSGKRLFSAKEIQLLLAAASPPLKAMILLGVNCGFGNSDISDLPQSVVDFENGWIEFPRPKTGIERRCPIWPETLEALKVAIAERPDAKNATDAGLVFLTKYGQRWVRTQGIKETPIDAVSGQFAKLLKLLETSGRNGLGFYALRHTFRTIADASKDIPAVRLIMGHVDGGIDAVYREHIDDGRLRAVTEHVRQWLFGKICENKKPKNDNDWENGRSPAPAKRKSVESRAEEKRPALRIFAG